LPERDFGEGAIDFDLASRVGNVSLRLLNAPSFFFSTDNGSLRYGRLIVFSKFPYLFRSCALRLAGLV